MPEGPDDESVIHIGYDSHHDGPRSIVRQFHESGQKFEWVEGYGQITGNHCELTPRTPMPFTWRKFISSKSALIEIFEVDKKTRFTFNELFVVKDIRRNSKAENDCALARDEIEVMKDLRHPHISVLLGSYMYNTRLCLMIFPAAIFDLRIFMERLSNKIKHDREIREELQSTAPYGHESGIEHTKCFPHPISNQNLKILDDDDLHQPGKTKDRTGHFHPDMTLDESLDLLRHYFVCLSEVLAYLHRHDVRHKDIKPANILIDANGAPVLIDFGISKKFAKNTSHVTTDKRPQQTPKYAAPEMVAQPGKERSDPSDVYSLGLVLLEMVSLILRRDLQELTSSYATATEDAYHAHLPKIQEWIDALSASERPISELEPLKGPHRTGQDHAVPGSDEAMISALPTIRKMINPDPNARPTAWRSKEDTKSGVVYPPVLWECFMHVSPWICQDCDPRRSEDHWKTSVKQKEAADQSPTRHRFLQSEDTLDGRRNNLRADFDRDLLHPPPSISLPVGQRSPLGQLSPRPLSERETHGSQLTVSNKYVARHQDDASDRVHLRPLSSHGKKKRFEVSDIREGNWTGMRIAGESVSPIKDQSITEQQGGQDTSDVRSAIPAAHDTTIGPALSQVAASSDSTREGSGLKFDASAPHSVRQQTNPRASDMVVVYDFLTTEASVVRFDAINGEAYRCFPLPKKGKQLFLKIEGDLPNLLATIRLEGLSPWVRLRRRMGKYPSLYILHAEHIFELPV